ncbi:MAG: recombinase family protein [Woeseiaceae bacterium]
MEKKAKGGNWVGGSVPYGFRLDEEKRLVLHEEEALIVRKMFKMYAFGNEGASAICKQLNEAGHRNRNGWKWGRRVVLYMLKNPVYMGKIRWREVLYEGQHDGLVSELLFEKANEVLQERHEDLKGRQWHNGDERLHRTSSVTTKQRDKLRSKPDFRPKRTPSGKASHNAASGTRISSKQRTPPNGSTSRS